MEKLTITETRKQLLTLAKQFKKKHKNVIQITRNGETVMALLSSEHYESLIETLEILTDEKLVKQLKQALKQVATGKAIPWDKVKGSLELEE